MKYLIVFIFIGLLAIDISAFSLRKHSDESDESPESSYERKSSEKSSRRRFSDGSHEKSDSSQESRPKKSLAIGLNTGGSQGTKSDGVDKLIRVVKDLVARVNAEPLFRSKKFDFGESTGIGENKRGKSSVGIELDTPTLLNFVKKVISSKKFKKATDEVARKAAVIFRALKEGN